MSALLAHFGHRDLIQVVLAVIVFSVFFFFPRLLDGTFSRLEAAGTQLARKRGAAILSIALAAIVVRLLALPFLSVPFPQVHDEFSYLLAGDTFAHGRLTNPPHPMWVFFETIHVNQQPTYMSKYPPAQGAVLALGELLGHPWIGVLMSTAAMCAAILWMLQGWLPSNWALLGAVLALLRLAVFSYWVNSYWGGAVAAIGGALVVGAFPRIIKFRHPHHVLVLGTGAAILANSRPLEGAILCLPIMVLLLIWLVREFGSNWRRALSAVVLPLSVVSLLGASFIGYYNWRGTGNVLVFPYQVNEQTYSSVPTLLWLKPRPPLQYRNPQLAAYYNDWARKYWSSNRMDSMAHATRHVGVVVFKLVYFFLWPELGLVFITLPWLLRDRRPRILVLLALVCFFGFLAFPWMEPHYAAPMIGVLFAIVVQGIRHLRLWRFAGRPVGIGFSRAVVIAAILLAPYHHRSGTFEPETNERPRIGYRADFLASLKASPGKHLVLVRYSPAPNSGEWVYNDADIDDSKVVWAREIPGLDLHPLLSYFHDRKVWVAEPDLPIPRLSVYSQPQP